MRASRKHWYRTFSRNGSHKFDRTKWETWWSEFAQNLEKFTISCVLSPTPVLILCWGFEWSAGPMDLGKPLPVDKKLNICIFPSLFLMSYSMIELRVWRVISKWLVGRRAVKRSMPHLHPQASPLPVASIIHHVRRWRPHHVMELRLGVITPHLYHTQWWRNQQNGSQCHLWRSRWWQTPQNSSLW